MTILEKPLDSLNEINILSCPVRSGPVRSRPDPDVRAGGRADGRTGGRAGERLGMGTGEAALPPRPVFAKITLPRRGQHSVR